MNLDSLLLSMELQDRISFDFDSDPLPTKEAMQIMRAELKAVGE